MKGYYMKPAPRLSVVPNHNRSSKRRAARKRPDASVAPTSNLSDKEYRVGPGYPPREFQFKPGQSGNPSGVKRKKSSIALDLKALLERALSQKVKLGRGERKQIMTKAAAGIAKLVNQFAAGDRYARRDLITLADKLGVDLIAGQTQALEKALASPVTANDQALVDDYVRRRFSELKTLTNNSDLDPAQSADTNHSSEEKAK